MKSATKLILTVLVLGWLTVGGGVAQADPNNPSDQQAFYKSVSEQGLSGPQDTELTLGRQVCLLTKLGRDNGEIESYLHNHNAITTHEADIIRVAAQLNLC